VKEVYLFEEEKRALVVVPEEHLSLAIGKEGQNVRLAVKLIGWHIDIRSEEREEIEKVEIPAREETNGAD
jgi:N utilization substance protein A